MNEVTDIFNKQFESDHPVFIDAKINHDVLEDDQKIAGLKTGMSNPKDFFHLDFGLLTASAQKDYENGKYRFIGL